MNGEQLISVRVECLGGRWYGTSLDLPGLNMGGSTLEKLEDAVKRGIAFLLLAGHGPVTVDRVAPSAPLGNELLFSVSTRLVP